VGDSNTADCALQDCKTVAVLWWATQHSAVSERWYCSNSQKWILKNRGVEIWAGFIWHRIQTSGRLLWTWSWTSVFNKRCNISWLAAWLLSFWRRSLPHGTNICRMRISCSTAVEGSIPVGSVAVSSEQFQTFWRITRPPCNAYLNMKPLWSFKMLETMHPPEHYHIPEGIFKLVSSA